MAALEFPRHMHKDGGKYVVVNNQSEYDACEANGWSALPSDHVEQPKEVRVSEAMGDAAPKKKGKKE